MHNMNCFVVPSRGLDCSMHIRRGFGSSPSASTGQRVGSAGSSTVNATSAAGFGVARAQAGPDSDASMGTGGSNLVFCVSPALFETTGVLLPSAPWSLTMQQILKIRQECSTNTTISMNDWREIATTILGMQSAHASSLFDVFYSLNQPSLKQESRIEHSRVLLGKMGGAVDEAKWSSVSSSRVVSLPGLSMFLMAQMFLERPPKASVGEGNPETILTFVKQHLHDFVSSSTVTKPGRVTLNDVQELQLLLREVANGVEQPFGTSLGFLWTRTEKTIDVAVLTQFLRPRIVLPADIRAQGFPNNVVTKGIVSSVHIQPNPMNAGPANSGTTSSKFPSATFRIAKSAQSSFYVTAELPSTTLSQLSNCSVALGPVAGVLSIDRCENTTISALCGAVVLSNCRNVTLCICTNTPPVLGDGILSNEDVRIAPYNTHYSTLEEHLLSSGINPKLNLWRCGIANPFQLPPAEFSSVSFPIAPQGQAVVTTRTNPVPLPKAYSDALAARVLRFQQVSSMLQQTYRQLETSGRKDLSEGLRQKVHSMFLDYLYDNGQAKSLVDLLHQNAPTATAVPR